MTDRKNEQVAMSGSAESETPATGFLTNCSQKRGGWGKVKYRLN